MDYCTVCDAQLGSNGVCPDCGLVNSIPPGEHSTSQRTDAASQLSDATALPPGLPAFVYRQTATGTTPYSISQGKKSAIFSLVLGILGLLEGVAFLSKVLAGLPPFRARRHTNPVVFGQFFGVAAIIFGRKAKRLGFTGMSATVGIILGIVDIALATLSYAYFLFILFSSTV